MAQEFIGKYIRIEDLDKRMQNKIKKKWGTKFGPKQPIALFCAYKNTYGNVIVSFSSCAIDDLNKFTKGYAWWAARCNADIIPQYKNVYDQLPFHLTQFADDIIFRAKSFFKTSDLKICFRVDERSKAILKSEV